MAKVVITDEGKQQALENLQKDKERLAMAGTRLSNLGKSAVSGVQKLPKPTETGKQTALQNLKDDAAKVVKLGKGVGRAFIWMGSGIGSLKSRLPQRKPRPEPAYVDAIAHDVEVPAEAPVTEEPGAAQQKVVVAPANSVTKSDRNDPFPGARDFSDMDDEPAISVQTDQSAPVVQTTTRRSANPLLKRRIRLSADEEPSTVVDANAVSEPAEGEPENNDESNGLLNNGGSFGGRFGNFKETFLVWAKRVGAVLLIVIALAGGYVLISQSRHSAATTGTSANQIAAQAQSSKPPIVPKLTPLDLAHASWWSLLQYVVILLFALIVIGIAADAWNRGQISDFLGVIAGIGLMMLHGVIATSTIGWLGPKTWLNFTYLQLDWAWSLFCVGVAFASAYWVSQQGGFDLTPLAGFFTILGASGLLFGHMGAIQVLFNIPDAPIVPIGQSFALLSLKHTDQIGMSFLTYTFLATGSVLYAIEMIRTIVKEIDNVMPKIGYALTSVVGLVVYFATKNLLLANGTPPMVIIFLAILAGAAAAFGYRKANKKSNVPVGQGEIRLRNAWIPPWDKIAVQIAPALLLIAMVGHI